MTKLPNNIDLDRLYLLPIIVISCFVMVLFFIFIFTILDIGLVKVSVQNPVTTIDTIDHNLKFSTVMLSSIFHQLLADEYFGAEII